MTDQPTELNGADVFDDTAEQSSSEFDSTASETEGENSPEGNTESVGDDGKDESGKGEKLDASPPDADETKDQSQDEEKSIPVHRHKAALKDVTEKLRKAEQELAAAKAQPAPDRTKDPEGHERYMRIEVSKNIMRDAYADYDETITHFNEMLADTPALANAVADHPNPAKYAYDLAKKDLEIRDLSSLKSSDDWKQFQEWKKQQADAAKPKPKEVPVAAKVPNINRATNVNKPSRNADSDDALWKGAHF